MDEERDDPIVFPATVLEATDRALKVLNEDANEEQWVPRSTVTDGNDLKEGDMVDAFELAHWKALELGWAD